MHFIRHTQAWMSLYFLASEGPQRLQKGPHAQFNLKRLIMAVLTTQTNAVSARVIMKFIDHCVTSKFAEAARYKHYH